MCQEKEREKISKTFAVFLLLPPFPSTKRKGKTLFRNFSPLLLMRASLGLILSFPPNRLLSVLPNRPLSFSSGPIPPGVDGASGA